MASIVRRLLIMALLAVIPAASTMARAAETPRAPIVAHAEPVGPTAASSPSLTATSDDAAAYAAREKQSTGLQNYQGGGYIYIGGGVLTAALLVLLILVLI